MPYLKISDQLLIFLNLYQHANPANLTLAHISRTIFFPNIGFEQEHNNINFNYITNSKKINDQFFFSIQKKIVLDYFWTTSLIGQKNSPKHPALSGISKDLQHHPKIHRNLSFHKFAPACKKKTVHSIYSFLRYSPDWPYPFFNQILIYENLYHHAKKANSLICYGDMND